MDQLDRHLWEQLSPLIDQVLDLDRAGRASFLTTLDGERPELAGALGRLLAAHDRAAAEDFLAVGPSMATTPAADGLAGFRVGAYTLERPLGKGGMGTVWLGRRSDGQFTGTVAVKLVNLAMLDAGAVGRFSREASILARLTHANIARMYDAGVTPMGQPYLVLEYVEGRRIDHYTDEHALDVRARLGLFLQVADAVAHAHQNLVVHRDLKPSNILVGADGRVKLLDFGIAKLLGDGAAGDNARTTATRGNALTPEYAAPEQLSAGTVTTATDVYALGVLLFQLLSGQHPTAQDARTAADFLKALDQPASRLTAALRRAEARHEGEAIGQARGTTFAKLLKACGGDLDTILNVALKQEPAERYTGAAAFADDIRRYLRRLPVSAQPDSRWYRLRMLVARRKVESMAAAIAVCAVVCGASVAVWQARVAATERDFAMRQLQRAQAMNDLNEFLLTDAAPLGKAFTAGDVLARAEAIALKQRDTEAALKIDTLITLSRQYASQDESDKARQLAERAHSLSFTVDDESLKAKAACSYAASIADAGEYARAHDLAAGALAALPGSDLYALDRVFCRMLLAHVERSGPTPAVAIGLLQVAHDEMSDTGLGSPLLHVSVMMQLAESLRVAGRLAEAARDFERAHALLVSLGRDETETAGTLLNNWGLTMNGLGQPREAERLFRRAVGIASADGSDASVSPMLLTNLARPLVDLGRYQEAADIADRAAAIATETGYAVVYNQGLLLRAAAYRHLGDFARAGALLNEFAARAAQDIPPGHVAHDILVLDRGRLAAARGDAAAATATFDRVVAALDAPGDDRQMVLLRALHSRAAHRLSQHDAAGALADTERLVTAARAAADGRRSYLVGRAELLRGQALAALGRPAEARDALVRAREHLDATVGAEHAEARETHAALANLDRR